MTVEVAMKALIFTRETVHMSTNTFPGILETFVRRIMTRNIFSV